ncbi:ferredoxin--NADP reductase [Pseudophaeobacter sp. EL27]|uniref:ferredoxin--NADP reductase n=1 Tax=Pseudophaeobacter sp. EL27 TaxID=2107580 RepID=UPI000EFB2BFF|nr:ferredoxin--NADP reductase [Pseudophaeobacter sp. EL27]
MFEFHRLTIKELRPEIGGAATSVTFDLPAGASESFSWEAGQHVTLRFDLNGAEQRRSYTVSNPPGAPLRITVKREKGGLVSNHIATALSPGDQIEVALPFGRFVLAPDRPARRTHYFFGAGSGITPLFAMIHAVLSDEPHSVAHLIFGNRSADEILFREELDQLAALHPDRFSLRHTLSAPKLLSWFSLWRSGRLDADAVRAAIGETPPVAQDVQYWICGPGAMNGDVKSALMGVDVPANRIHMESFGGAQELDSSVTGCAATLRLHLPSGSHDIPVEEGQTLLAAIRSNGLSVPFSCQSGVCGACRARISDGTVHMRNRMALEDSDIGKGEILSCQSVAQTEWLEVDFRS